MLFDFLSKRHRRLSLLLNAQHCCDSSFAFCGILNLECTKLCKDFIYQFFNIDLRITSYKLVIRMILVLSTLPHLLSILPLVQYYQTYAFGYINTIALSTFFSVLYHLTEESNRIISFIDHLIAGLWFLYDIYMGYLYTDEQVLYEIIIVNCISCIISFKIPHDEKYELYHSYWHLLNACKCFYVSFLISKGIKDI